MEKLLEKKLKKIKLVITDVDGVLTDGGMYYTKDGDMMKKFHARDGMGVTLLRKIDIPTIILTKEKTEIVAHWSKNMKVKEVLDGVTKKESKLDSICKKNNVLLDEIAYVGDDVNDIEILKKVGLSITPKDGEDSVKKNCDYICSRIGGNGAFREVVNLILEVHNKI